MSEIKNIKDMNPEEIKVEIDRTGNFLDTINEFGEGHWNMIDEFSREKGTMSTYSDYRVRIPEKFYERAKRTNKEWEELNYRIDKLAFPRLDEVVKQTVFGSYIPSWIGTAMRLISPDEIDEYLEKRKELQEGEFREDFTIIGTEVKKIHEDYISFLESIENGK